MARIELPGKAPPWTRERRVYGVTLIAFASAALLTWSFIHSMAGGMTMPGGWTMSMMWMVMPRQTWLAAASIFLVMWQAMMVAMMLPSALPMLLVYRRAALFRHQARVGASLWALAGAYFTVWLGFGAVAYGLGMTVNAAAMRWPVVSLAIPSLAGAALIAAGVYQLTPWKSACLRRCRDPLDLVSEHVDRGVRGAARLGAVHGAFCAGCCWSLMLIQLVLGVMNVGAMVLVAGVIAAEKLLPVGPVFARAVGLASTLGGLWLLARGLR
jgi:predicted metal-binding membrane protein